MTPRKLALPLILLLATAASGAAYLKLKEPGPSMTQTTQAFLASLDEKQLATATAEFSDPKRLDWHFIPKDERKGLQLREMTDAQKKAAHKTLQAALSEIGYEKSTVIMDLESILNKLEGDKGRWARDPLRYYWTVFGTPSNEGKWGLSVEGHHLSLNFVVEGGKVVSHTPAFLGANPGLVMADYGVGPKKGTRVLDDEELLGFKLINSTDDAQRNVALIAEKAPADVRAAGEAHPPATSAEGLPASQMTDDQKKTLRGLLRSYLENMPAEIAQQRWSEIQEAGFDKIHFAWAGALQPGIGHYYRVQGPTFQVEFCNTQPDGAGNPANHIHCMWRNTGGDFGIAR